MIFIVHASTFFKYHRYRLSVLRQDFLRTPAVMNRDLLLGSLQNLLTACRHFIPALQAEHGDRPAATAGRRPCCVNSNVSAADHNHIPAKVKGFFRIRLPKKLNSRVNAFGILAGYPRFPAALAAHRNVKSFIPLLPKLGNGDILPHFHTAFDLHPHGPYHVNFRLDQVFF